MFVTPLHLIDQTIDDLEALTEVLSDEVDTRVNATTRPEGKLCKEALLTISVLLPKLKAVRCSPVAMTVEYRSACPTCDDN
jgi:hypothetical protein